VRANPLVIFLSSDICYKKGMVVMKILIIEDERKTASFLRQGLQENGYIVDVAEDGIDGLHYALSGHYDLLMVDVMLPGRDGFSIVSELRKAGNTTLALFLTARDGIQDRVKGLDLGADAYLVKPFAFSELLAQIRSLLRRGGSRQPEVVRVLDLEIDFTQHKASRAGKRLDLRPKEFQLLGFLARRAGEVVSRSLIAEQVWDMNFDSDSNIVDVHIRRLRSKADIPFEKKLIHTVRGIGYVLREQEN
jgi:two-component system, OmpR family, copper resistance phosphate regulon response regulator CusR